MATQIASPQSTRAKASTIPQEDIRSVLERFQKWTGGQADPVRELSYEEAVARSRRRVYDDEPLGPDTLRAAACPIPAPPPPIPFPLIKEPPAREPGNRPSRPAPQKTSKTSAAIPIADRPHDSAANSSLADPPKPPPKTAPRKASSAAAPRRARNSPPKTTARTAHREPLTTLRKSATSPPVEAVTPSASESLPHIGRTINASEASAYVELLHAANTPPVTPPPQATFAQVLAAQFQPTAPESEAFSTPTNATPPAQPSASPVAAPTPALAKPFAVTPLPDDAPAVHLTVRLAAEERENLRERAHDLGITPSAYVRQCALEVDSLRVELENSRVAQAQVVAELARAQDEAQSARSAAALCLSTRIPHRRAHESEWFTRLRNFVFPRKPKSQAFATRA